MTIQEELILNLGVNKRRQIRNAAELGSEPFTVVIKGSKFFWPR